MSIKVYNCNVKKVCIGFLVFIFALQNFVYGQHQSQSKLNILWLVAEDISPYLSFYGDSTAKTPNLDRLAREGIVFKNVFDVSGVCAPSRSCLITGMYPTSIGTNNMRTLNVLPEIGIPKYSVVLPPQVKMFSELMRVNGYYCTNNSKQDYQFVAPRSGWDDSSNDADWKNRPAGKPFFSVFNFNVTHESQIWQKKNDPLLVDPAKVSFPPYYPESPIIRQDVARMYSNIMEMDKEVGEKLKQLEDAGLLDETIIIWYADNGGPLPRGKREIYDSGIHVPLVIRFPNKKSAGTINQDLISFVDFAPTMLSLAGIKIPEYMQGQAFLGNEKAKQPRKYVYAARDRMDSEYDMVRAVRDNRFKYIKNFQPEKPYMQDIAYRKKMNLMKELLKYEKEGKLNDVQKRWFNSKDIDELYDTKNDPFELHNLASDPRYAKKLNELKSELSAWMKKVDDKGFIPEKKWIESMWPNMVQPITLAPVFHLKGTAVSIVSATPGASISYQIVKEGQQANDKDWQVYSHPLKINKEEKVIAVAERIGYKSSDIKEL